MKQKFNYDNEIPKYIKKRKSSASKSKEKSNHKHIYTDCLLIEYSKPYKAKYCKLCGKIKDIKIKEFIELDNDSKRILSDAEIFENYNNLEHFQINDIFQKYVSID